MKVYDIFLYNGEKELLEIRLNTLKDIADYFVLIESPLTFTGLEKPIFYKKEDYPEFKDKIIHVIGPKAHKSFLWANEWFSRNLGGVILPTLKGDEILLLSDVDEIPNPDVLKEVIKTVDSPVTLNQSYRFYKFNMESASATVWPGTVITQACHVNYGSPNIEDWFTNEFGLQALREGRATYPKVELGGWHFSNCLDISEIQRKLKSFCHAPELDTKERNDPDHIAACIEKGESIWVESDGNRFKKIELNESNTPKYILENLEKYKHLIL